MQARVQKFLRGRIQQYDFFQHLWVCGRTPELIEDVPFYNKNIGTALNFHAKDFIFACKIQVGGGGRNAPGMWDSHQFFHVTVHCSGVSRNL